MKWECAVCDRADKDYQFAEFLISDRKADVDLIHKEILKAKFAYTKELRDRKRKNLVIEESWGTDNSDLRAGVKQAEKNISFLQKMKVKY